MYSREIAELQGRIRAKEKELGEDHPQVAALLSQLAHLYFVYGSLGDCERLYFQAVHILSERLGQEHLFVAALQFDLGYLLESQERYQEAEQAYRLAYAIRCINLGPGHHDSLQVARCLIKVLRAQGRMLGERDLERLSKLSA